MEGEILSKPYYCFARLPSFNPREFAARRIDQRTSAEICGLTFDLSFVQ